MSTFAVTVNSERISNLRSTILNAKPEICFEDEYRDLVVRVAGFSAFFINLDTKTQDDIIHRTLHGSLG